MKYVTDKTGRFTQRPHYEPRELDDECEKFITDFLRSKYGSVAFPIATNDLTLMIERDASELDLYADLSREGPDVQGVTYFYPKKKPVVRIAKDLTETEGWENRLRTTLTHEWGHVKFHNHVWQLDLLPTELRADIPASVSPKCKRDGILNAPQRDWMEWQAGYISGALLMPISAVKDLFSKFSKQYNLFAPIAFDSKAGLEIVRAVVNTFQVSEEAARVRLFKLGLFSARDEGPSLL